MCRSGLLTEPRVIFKLFPVEKMIRTVPKFTGTDVTYRTQFFTINLIA